MSDGTIDFAGDDMSTSFAAYAPMAERKSSGHRPDVDMHTFAEWLPRLGAVLWLYRDARDPAFPRARLTAQGVLLLEHPALTALANCTAAHARSAVTPRGPREWIDFDSNGATTARMYLLPDTDCMAWDGMLRDIGGTESVQAARDRRWHAHRAFMRCAFGRMRAAWQARIVRMPLLRLPCLQVLGLRAAHVSSLGRQLAAAIAEDEAARFLSAETQR